MKKCGSCSEYRDESVFRKHPTNPNSLFSWCKPCENKKGKIRKKEKIRAKIMIDPRVGMVENARKRAKRLHIEFDLKPEDLDYPETCPVLDIKLVPNLGAGRDNSYSLDKTDPNKGYVKSNVSVMSMRANRLKSNAKPEELAAILEKIYGWICVPPAALEP